MKGLFKEVRQGQGGFTLVEVLLVAILGIITTIAMLAVSKFSDTGNLETAQSKLCQARTAIDALLAEAEINRLDPDGAARKEVGWNGGPNMIQATPADSTIPLDAADYVHGLFKARYKVEDDGRVSGIGSGGHIWSGIHWDNNHWESEPAPSP